MLIFDEVITAFGRLGTATASDYFGVTPDMITIAKGITSGVVPMGAVVVSDHIHDTMMERADGPIELFHGYTYSGHPIACAAGLASLEIYREEGLFERARELAPFMEEAVHSLRDARHVIDVRNLGLVGAVELEPRAGAIGARGLEAIHKAWEKGIMIRVTGDIIAFSPPLIVSKEEIEIFCDLTRKALLDIA